VASDSPPWKALSSVAMMPADTDIEVPASEREGTRRRSRRALALIVCAALLGVWWQTRGLPIDYVSIFLLLWLVTIAWNIDRPWRSHLLFVRDWGPVLLLLELYDLSRLLAAHWLPPHITFMIRADRAIFGVVPTEWLQNHLYQPGHTHWWDIAIAFVYFSHFVVSLTVAVILWLRNRALWAAYMRRFFVLTAAGLVTYFVFPAAPPWYAARYGYIHGPIARLSGEGWKAMGFKTADTLVNVGQAHLSNPVAAMPSLHSAFALLAVAFFFGRVRRRWIPVLVLYPLAMTFTLVYAGEHFFVDILVGWAYVALTFVVVGAWERRRA
jgi:membrane-associated phospholipid phosphatase